MRDIIKRKTKEDKMESDIIELQIKFTHQEELLSQLNQIVNKQQVAIDELVKELTRLKITTLNSQPEINNEKPPHY
jgi:SlyX protein